MSFCSRASAASHEAMAGTGVRGDAYLFLPVPKRHWRDSEMNAGWAAAEELDAIRAARSAGVVTRLYNPVAEDEPMLLRTAEPADRPPGLGPLLDRMERRWRLDETSAPLIAVCTHGTRDRCCAKWGFSAFRQAQALFEAGVSPFRPIESSHLGGDRFAATAVVFPSGSMYGRLDQADLKAVLADEAAGRLSPAAYRGRVFDPPLVQLVRAGLARDGLCGDSAAPLSVHRGEDGRLMVEAPAGRFLANLHSVELAFYPSCHHMAEGRLSRGRRQVWAGAVRAE